MKNASLGVISFFLLIAMTGPAAHAAGGGSIDAVFAQLGWQRAGADEQIVKTKNGGSFDFFDKTGMRLIPSETGGGWGHISLETKKGDVDFEPIELGKKGRGTELQIDFKHIYSQADEDRIQIFEKVLENDLKKIGVTYVADKKTIGGSIVAYNASLMNPDFLLKTLALAAKKASAEIEK